MFLDYIGVQFALAIYHYIKAMFLMVINTTNIFFVISNYSYDPKKIKIPESHKSGSFFTNF